MNDIIENEDVDRDTIDAIAIEKQFAKKYDMLSEVTVSQKKNYINKIAGTKSMKFAVIMPDNGIEIYELNNSGLMHNCHLIGHEKKVTEVVFNPREDNMLFSASEDGIVKVWDIRNGGSFVHDYKDEEEEMIRPYECMDVSYNGRVMCAGSQVVQDDAYLVFWDQRNPKPLGGYWNSHTEDVTQVKFHKEKMEILATGSIDGLVNVFDITEQTEDDALTYSLNMENALDKITWLDNKMAACTTQSNDLQIWNLHTGDLVNIYKREKIARSIMRTRQDDCYLVDVFMSSEGAPLLLAGSYGGCEDTLRSVRMSGRSLRPRTDFNLNRQIVRTSWYDDETDILLTAGEAGIINVWRGVPCDPEMDLDSDLTDPESPSESEDEDEDEERRGGDNAQMDAEVEGDDMDEDEADDDDDDDEEEDDSEDNDEDDEDESSDEDKAESNGHVAHTEEMATQTEGDLDIDENTVPTANGPVDANDKSDDNNSENDKADDDDDSSVSSSDSDSSSDDEDDDDEDEEAENAENVGDKEDAPGKLPAARDKLHANRHKPY